MFIERGILLCKPLGMCGMVTMQSWMFLSSYEALRKWILDTSAIDSLVQIGYNSFPELNSKVAQACAFVITPAHPLAYGTYFNLNDISQSADKGQYFFDKKRHHIFKVVERESFRAIPGLPIAHWVSEKVRNCFTNGIALSHFALPKQGMATADNDRFVRLWWEVACNRIGIAIPNRVSAEKSNKKWFPYNNGGKSRKWYGNNEDLVNWKEDGAEIVALKPKSVIRNPDYFFQPGITWSAITSGDLSARIFYEGYLFSNGGMCIFPEASSRNAFAGLLNSKVGVNLLKILSPTINYGAGEVSKLPVFLKSISDQHSNTIESLISIFKMDWDSFEGSWDFDKSPLVSCGKLLSEIFSELRVKLESKVCEAQRLEEENNRCFIVAYGLQSELTPEVSESQITLARADREKDCQRLISYAIGCMMGRYSLDEPGLIYAHAGNVGFEPGRYATFPADADGIVPITDELWFADDACSRIREFLRAVWGTDTLEENMTWLAESLGTKASETSDETIRRYIADKFFKDHLQTYKKRPIYWLFSSGKQGAFQALVYLHRYHEGTLARLRAEYVVPLTGKIQSRVEMLQKDAAAASSTAARNKLAKEVEKLKKKHVELLAYDEQLRHYADMRITLDLDDGVKVNYGKFGDLLAEVKAVTGGAGDE